MFLVNPTIPFTFTYQSQVTVAAHTCLSISFSFWGILHKPHQSVCPFPAPVCHHLLTTSWNTSIIHLGQQHSVVNKLGVLKVMTWCSRQKYVIYKDRDTLLLFPFPTPSSHWLHFQCWSINITNRNEDKKETWQHLTLTKTMLGLVFWIQSQLLLKELDGS